MSLEENSVSLQEKCQPRYALLFRTIRYISTKSLPDFLGGKRVIMSFTEYGDVFVSLICKSLQKCAASSSWTPKHHCKRRPFRSRFNKQKPENSHNISPGLTTPSNPERISLVSGWRALLRPLIHSRGFSIDPNVG